MVTLILIFLITFECHPKSMTSEVDWVLKANYLSKDLTLHCDLEERNPHFLHDTPGHGDAPSYQVWLHTDQWFRRYLPYKGVTHGQPDSRIRGGGRKGGGKSQLTISFFYLKSVHIL